jgi:hypothetical protein
VSSLDTLEDLDQIVSSMRGDLDTLHEIVRNLTAMAQPARVTEAVELCERAVDAYAEASWLAARLQRAMEPGSESDGVSEREQVVS